jgi:hypothetical protein
MSLILHLSDLHLGPPSPGQRDYDDKVGMEGDAGETDIDHLEHTLEALGQALTDSGRKLDAIVVTGDITKGNHKDGYDAFPALLDLLGEARPVDERIIVLPGNHDVDKDLEPGDRNKLARFMDATRPRYSTPLVKGLDYKGNELHRNPGSRGRPQPIVDLGDAVVVAINSADYCWIREHGTKTDWDAVIADYLADEDGEAAVKKRDLAAEELAKLRTHDIPKVDKVQINALKKRLDRAGVDDRPDRDPRLRIAAIHHPISPATDQEEIKPFEVITNLAIVRTLLFNRGFHLVLHGHKHTAYAAWDWLQPPEDDLAQGQHRAIVLGAPGVFRTGETVCRLIEACPDAEHPVAGAPRIRVIPIAGVDASASISLDFATSPTYSLAQPAFVRESLRTPWIVEAENADAAYEQIRDLPVGEESPRAVISVVTDPSSTSTFPTNYPGTKKVPSLEDLVNWWQLPRPEAVNSYSGSEFNHGERLYGNEDALEKAVRALPSSKAFALLVRPGEPGDSDRESPAFLGIHFQARMAGSQHELDVVGTYRKQDLDLWWPVNMAELSLIQQAAVAKANDLKVRGFPYGPGRLTAIAVQGVHDDVLPQMAGTMLDRAVDLRPEWIYRLAYLAARPDSAGEDSEVLRQWRKALGDIGKLPPGGLLVPSVGIRRLRDALATHPERETTPEFRKLVRTIATLAERAAAVEAALRDQKDEPSASSLQGWADQLQDLARQCEKVLKAAVRRASKA